MVDSPTRVPGSTNVDCGDAGSGELAGTTLLLVDDRRSTRQSMGASLSHAGYRVIAVQNGFDALSMVLKYKPAIVITQIMMPRLDGYQTCALIKGNAECAATTVVMVCNREGVYDSERARLAGCDDHLSHPFSEKTLISLVEQHVVRLAE